MTTQNESCLEMPLCDQDTIVLLERSPVQSRVLQMGIQILDSRFEHYSKSLERLLLYCVVHDVIPCVISFAALTTHGQAFFKKPRNQWTVVKRSDKTALSASKGTRTVTSHSLVVTMPSTSLEATFPGESTGHIPDCTHTNITQTSRTTGQNSTYLPEYNTPFLADRARFL